MLKLVFVDELPQNLQSNEYLIGPISFLEEIESCKSMEPRGNLTGTYHLHAILDVIYNKYNVKDKKSRATIPVHRYVGLQYSSYEELNDIVVRMLHENVPFVLEDWLQFKITNKPLKIDTVVFYDQGLIKYALDVFVKNNIVEDTSDKQRSKKSKKVYLTSAN